MIYLLATSLLWAFSFGIIGSRLAGLDSTFSAALRLAIAFLCFLPFFRRQALALRDLLALVGIGALQFGSMYLAYMKAYAFLPSHLVALFSVLTPLYIVIADNLSKSRWQWSLLGCAILSIAGATVIKYSQPSGSFWLGFGLMQIANLSFGLGQLAYRSWRLKRPDIKDLQIMAPLYLGGATLAGLGFLFLGDFQKIHPTAAQWQALVYLGIIASGLGFFLWNKGATQTNPGALAAANNAVVPIAMATSLFYFDESSSITSTSIAKLLIGATLIFAAIAWAKKSGTNSKSAPL